MARQALTCVLALALTLPCLCVASAAPTEEQKAEITEVGELMKQAGALFKEKKHEECGEVVSQIQQKIELLSATGDAVILRQLEPVYKRLKEGHAALELQGIELSPLVPLSEPKPKEKPAPTKPMPEPAAGGVSFVKQVAPLLITKCGRCHVNKSEGGFNSASYAALMKGSDAGKVVFPGDASGSRVIELIESGDMPRGGKMADEETNLLKKWITEGAKFDGADANAAITGFASAPAPTTPAEPMVVQATGKESVSFARDIAPVLSKTCTGCHGTNQPRQNFSLNTFTALMKGGDSGSPVEPGKGAESLLVMKLKGTAGGMRMPAGNLPPLADDVIAKIQKWIDEGAKFDGPDANTTLAQVASLAKAAGSTHEQLLEERKQLAEATWATAMPQVKHDTVETENFYAKGTVGENTLKDILEKSEQLVPKIAAALNAPSDKPLVKGRFTVLAVNVRYDFSEIGKVLLNTTNVPPKSTSLWRYDGVDATGVVMVPRNESDYAVEALIAEQATAAHLSGTGKNVPRWFAAGVGRAVTARLMPTDKQVQLWDQNVPAAFASLASPSIFMDSKFDPEIGGLAAYSYGRYLMNDSKRFNKLLDDLRRGAKFDDAFASAYGAPPAAVAEVWYRKGPGRPVRTKSAAKSAKSE